jgi:hypothetical protein
MLPTSNLAKLLRIHISESDTHKGKPLYEAIVAKCREMGIAGATVFRGLEGFGESAEMHKAHLGRNDRPIVITIVDSAERLAALAPVVEAMMDTGMTAISDVQMIRVQKKKSAAT